MKCRSVACVWPDMPPPHRVTAIAAITRPPALYTGSSNGSIILWNLSGEYSNQEIKPVAMLCGHSAPITDMCTCRHLPDSAYIDYLSLLSSSTDGFLCTWTRGYGHCTRKRKLPPSLGSPIKLRTLPSNQRYVCIGCCLLTSNELRGYELYDSVDYISDHPLRTKSSDGGNAKCSLIIVDSFTLSVIRTIPHDTLPLGRLKFMEIISVGKKDEEMAVVVNSSGKIHPVSISGGNIDGEKESTSHGNSPAFTIWDDGMGEWGPVVFFAKCAELLAIVYASVCVFKLIDDRQNLGEIYFSEDSFYFEGSSDTSHVAGAMFLEDGVSAFEAYQRKTFAVWNNGGYVVVYLLSFSKFFFSYEPLYGIPGLSFHDVNLSAYFIKLDPFLIRVVSANVIVPQGPKPSVCVPNITMWSLSKGDDCHGKLWPFYRRVGHGYYSIDGCKKDDRGNFVFSEESELRDKAIELAYFESHLPQLESETGVMEKQKCLLKGWVIYSSIFIADGSPFPRALVYGFYNGKIELIEFHLVSVQLNSCKGGSTCKHYFSGHTGPVLCLAAHQMVGSCRRSGSCNILISGSKDCTIRLWDLDAKFLITVLHHHVAPVRQIILAPSETEYPWFDCFLSVADDSCVSLVSLETLRVERMFAGHSKYPSRIAWDAPRGYLACLCQSYVVSSDSDDLLYIWDIKSGARERVIHGLASASIFDRFCSSIENNTGTLHILKKNSSAPRFDDSVLVNENTKHAEESSTAPFSPRVQFRTVPRSSRVLSSQLITSSSSTIKLSCPVPGIATLHFDLWLLMYTLQKREPVGNNGIENNDMPKIAQYGDNLAANSPAKQSIPGDANASTSHDKGSWLTSVEGIMLRLSLSFLHLWGFDPDLDKLLTNDLRVEKPGRIIVSSGLEGDGGALVLSFPGLSSCLELWKSSSEFCAIRSLMMVSLSQQMITLLHSSSAASSALAAFYTHKFAEKFPDITIPSLQIFVSFWQDNIEYVRIAAHSLFHAAAPRAIPLPLRCHDALVHVECLNSVDDVRESIEEEKKENVTFASNKDMKLDVVSELEQSEILAWLDSYEMQDWISCIDGTCQDAKASHIIVTAALAIWYPALVKPNLYQVIVHPLIKLVMATNNMYSTTAAELLARGMESTWKKVIGSEISHLLGDIFFQIECVSGASGIISSQSSAISDAIREALVGILLPSLAAADIPGFLNVIDSQVWSTTSDSPVHLVSLITLASVIRNSPKQLAPYLDKVVAFILQTLDPSNPVIRRSCFSGAITTLEQVVHTFPMVALNDKSTRLAVGDAVGKIKYATIRIYDLQSVKEIKALDASGLPGLPNLLPGGKNVATTTIISALKFSPDGEGLVAFSEHGLVIRWWSLTSFWWERLGRSATPVQCTKLILVPPWDGLSPTSCRSSIMASITEHGRYVNLQEKMGNQNDDDYLAVLIYNLDLSYRLEWLGERKVLLKRGALELGTFLL